MTTQQAADRIGASVRHVQRLVADGGLVAIGNDRIDAESVAQWMAQRAGSRVRAWEEPTAWAAVALLEGEPAPWLGQAQRSRLRSTLADVTAAELAARTRNRAEVHRFHAHPRSLSHLARDVIDPGTTGEPRRADDREGPARRLRRPARPAPPGAALPTGLRPLGQRRPPGDEHQHGRRGRARPGTPARAGGAGPRDVHRCPGALGGSPDPRPRAGAAAWLTSSDHRPRQAAGLGRGRMSPSWQQRCRLRRGR